MLFGFYLCLNVGVIARCGDGTELDGPVHREAEHGLSADVNQTPAVIQQTLDRSEDVLILLRKRNWRACRRIREIDDDVVPVSQAQVGQSQRCMERSIHRQFRRTADDGGGRQPRLLHVVQKLTADKACGPDYGDRLADPAS